MMPSPSCSSELREMINYHSALELIRGLISQLIALLSTMLSRASQSDGGRAPLGRRVNKSSSAKLTGCRSPCEMRLLGCQYFVRAPGETAALIQVRLVVLFWEHLWLVARGGGSIHPSVWWDQTGAVVIPDDRCDIATFPSALFFHPKSCSLTLTNLMPLNLIIYSEWRAIRWCSGAERNKVVGLMLELGPFFVEFACSARLYCSFLLQSKMCI